MKMTNAEWLQENGYKPKDIRIYKNVSNDKSWNYGIRIAKTNLNVYVKGNGYMDALLILLGAEHEERGTHVVHEDQILDSAEKEYLGNFIKPFRNMVYWIAKISGTGKCFIRIEFNNDGVDDRIDLPLFDENKMYKGMEPNEIYTLEELGI